MLWNSMLGKALVTFLISMIPIIELRGAIPIAAASGLSLQTALVAAVIGNLLPVPFIIIFVRKIFTWLRIKGQKWNRIVIRLENRTEQKSDIVRRYAFWGLALFVAIPFPGTGAWTGALIAAMLDMRLKRAFPAIALGVIVAGTIVAIATYGAGSLLFGEGTIS